MSEDIPLGEMEDNPPPEQPGLQDDDNYGQEDNDDDTSNSQLLGDSQGGDTSNSPLLGGGSANFITNEETIAVVNMQQFLDNVVVDYPKEYKNPNFIRYLVRKHKLGITSTTSIELNTIDYEIEYNGEPRFNEDGNDKVQPSRNFTILDNNFEDESQYQQFKGDMKYLYDKWKVEVNKKRMKKAGVVGGVLIAIGSLITGLSLGLKRTGHNMVHDSKIKWKKLTPAEKKKIFPWIELEKASGKSAIIVGDYIYIIIGGGLIYALSK